MSVHQLLSAELEHGIPSLLARASVVALVPATELRGWASEMAWAIARAAAAGGRRTVLVDCFVNAPTLHGAEGQGNDEGLVDAFEYGASLNRIVQQQPQADLFFIPAGTYSADAEPLMQNPRWKRLSAGFRHEEALLLLYVAAEHLAGLAAEPDGIIVLAPQGQDLVAADAPALAEAVGRGMPLIAVVADEQSVARASGAHRTLPADASAVDRRLSTVDSASVDSPQSTADSKPALRAPMAMLLDERPGFAWGTWMTIVLLLAAVSGGSWWMIARRQSTIARTAPAADSATAPVRALPPPPPPVESLPFAVQVASVPLLADAFALSDSLTARGTPAVIAPVRLRNRGVLYRVLAGPYASAPRADSALAALRASHTVAATGGSVADVPLSLDLGTVRTRGGAIAERDRLRAAGVPVFILGQADGSFRLYAGAYDAGAQALLLQDLLTPTGGAGVLAPRRGYVP